MLNTYTAGAALSPSTMERIERISDRRETIRSNARSPRTVRAYESDWRQLQAWADGLGVGIPDPDQLTEPLPVGIIEGYLVDRSDPDVEGFVTPQTLGRHLSAIRYWHRQAGHVSPTDHPVLADTIAGIRRTEGTDTRQAKPIYLDDLKAMTSGLGDGAKGTRDRALLTVGWWGAFRRSELVGITRSDITDDPQGAVIRLRRSKTDQEGKGFSKAVEYRTGESRSVCPVVSLRRWLTFLDDDGGPVFRSVTQTGVIGAPLSSASVALIVKQHVARIGLDPARYSGHSLRAGFVSEADRRRIPTSAVRLVTGHKSDAMLSGYTRPRSLFESSAGAFFDGE